MRICLGAVVLLLFVFPAEPSTHEASGRFEVYCDSVGFYLGKIDGAPAPAEFFLLMYRGFPGFIDALPGGSWLEVSVYPKDCRADGKCETRKVADGRLWLDAEHDPGGKQISGKYDIDFNGQHATGRFAATRREYKKPPRMCE
jgi:hypothetical protein